MKIRDLFQGCNQAFRNSEPTFQTRLLYAELSSPYDLYADSKWGYIDGAKECLEGYKDQFNTNDKNEACSNSYWRASKIRVAYEIKDLKEMLQEIDEMMQEEVKQLDEADEDTRENRSEAAMGI